MLLSHWWRLPPSMTPRWPPPLRWNRTTALRVALAGGLVLYAVLSTCSLRIPLLERVQALQVLRVATLNSPTTYYEGVAGPTGFEYDLTRNFAHDLGVEIEILVADGPSEVLNLVRSGRAHLGAGLGITPDREKQVRFTPPLRSTELQLVYRAGRPKPKSFDELEGTLVVQTGSAEAEALKALARTHPQLHWSETEQFGAEQLLFRVANEEADYTIASSDVVAINRRYQPQLRVAFALTDPQNIAWAFAPGDDSLLDTAIHFVDRLDPGQLAAVHDRHFGYLTQVGP
ncbi:MAG: transporter substrate-binding domain-containing protein, partial [Nevskiales bacterium]|nr:transporter substrate-binding domain-containing protein [Nevskiales bacterium]